MMPSCSSSKGTHDLPAAVESLNLIEMHEHVSFAEQRMSLFQDDRESRQKLIDDFAEQIQVTLWVLNDALIDNFSFKALKLGQDQTLDAIAVEDNIVHHRREGDCNLSAF
jgi:hypothetical protein